MEQEQTIVTLLIELDKILKLENKEDVMNALYYAPNSYQDAIRAKYARSIYRARKLLGLSLESKRGGLFEEEVPDATNYFRRKTHQKSPA